MKTFLLLSALSILSLTLGAFFITRAGFEEKFRKHFSENYNFSWTENKEEGEVKAKGIRYIVLDVGMGEVKINPQKNEKKTISYIVKFSGEESPLDFKREGDVFKMTLKNKKINKNAVELFIPQTEKPLNFRAGVDFGSLKLEPGLYFDDFTVEMSAGEMKTEALSFSKGDIELSAGEIRMEATDLKEVEVSVSGGSVHLEVINPAPSIDADVNAGELKFGMAEGVEKNFSLKAEVSLGDIDLVEGYTKSGDSYVYGEGKGKVNLEVDLGQVEVF